jgi:hypothetical protein
MCTSTQMSLNVGQSIDFEENKDNRVYIDSNELKMLVKVSV